MGHTRAPIFLPRSYCQTYSGYPRVGFCLSTGRCTGASSTRHHRFPGAKGAKLHFSNTMAAEFTGSEPSRLKHLILLTTKFSLKNWNHIVFGASHSSGSKTTCSCVNNKYDAMASYLAFSLLSMEFLKVLYSFSCYILMSCPMPHQFCISFYLR